ncbi:protein-lysine N-methyltransferase EEF2KMT-like [Styela clava]|uniref:protein-lysine N-methyltransferase EEF2KMT-like n=1 Tax=Styela clava TaxID=7725 RepID=UPI001939D8E7|nr:protein-lysine N-methyltransferase EEF2KMT-like [Styela clava]
MTSGNEFIIEVETRISIHTVTIQFLCGVAIRELPWQFIVDFVEEEKQNEILNKTIFHPLCKKYSVGVLYQRSFCKKFIKEIEDRNQVVSESLCQHYVSLLSMENTPYSYKIYYIPGICKFVPILESRNLLSNGTTGLNTWQGAKVLAEWCLCNPGLIKNKKILELGCGAGFSGIMTLKTCQPLSYTFTDYHSEVMSLLCHNVKMNFDAKFCDSFTEKNPSEIDNLKLFDIDNISVKSLDWTDSDDTDALIKENGPFDIVFAADVVFDPAILNHLVKTVRSVLRHSTALNDHNKKVTDYPFACFSITVRNPSTFELFLHELDKYGLDCIEMPLNVFKVFYFDGSSDVKLLKIVLRL